MRFALVASLVCASTSALAAPTSEQSAAAPARGLLHESEALAAWLSTHSGDVRAAHYREDQARAAVGASRVFPNPVLDASLADVPLSKTNPPGLGFGRTAIYGVGLSETFELGKRGPRAEGAELRERAARLDTTSTLAERMALAREAIGRAVHLALRGEILRESLADAERGAALERTRLEQKALSGVDYDRLELELAQLRADFARDQAEYAAARADCAAALGAECNLAGASEGDLALPGVREPSEQAEARLLGRADLRALGLEADASRRDSELASNRAIPDVTVRVGYTYDRFGASGDNLSTLAVGLELPLPVFDRGQHDARKANEHALELEAEKQAVLTQARADLRGLVSRRAALANNLAVLERETLPRSSGVVTSTERAFHEGGASMTELLLARRSHIALSLMRLDEHFELFELDNELYRVLGQNPTSPPGKP